MQVPNTIAIYESIGDGGITASQFNAVLDYVAQHHNTIHIRINSVGGSVWDGYGIYAAIRRKIDEGYEMHGYNDGVAASMAAVILQAFYVPGKKRRHVAPYSLTMIHDPHMGDADTSEKDKEILQKVKVSISSIVKDSATAQPDDIDAMFAAETWMEAEQAVSNGLADDIVGSSMSKEVKEPEQLQQTVYQMSQFQSVAAIYKSINKSIKKMDKVIEILNLKESATQTDVLNAVQKMQNELSVNSKLIDELRNEKTELEAKLKTASDQVSALNETVAESVVIAAIDSGKFASDKKDELVTMAKENPELFASISEKISVKAPDLKAMLGSGNTGEGREDWTARDWETKDAKGWAALKNSNPDKWNKIYNAYYKAV